MTPAEKLAAAKPPRKHRAGCVTSKRKVVWQCRVLQERESLRLSLRDVAQAIGLSQTGLWDIEHGTEVMLTTARKLSEFFGRPIEELWPARAGKRK